MAYRESGYGGFGLSVTPWVKRLLIANTAIFLAAFIVVRVLGYPEALLWLRFEPANWITRPWTLLTYAFVHYEIGHILGNLLTLFFFGSPLEERWGSRTFLRYYLVAAAGAAIFCVLFAFLDPSVAIIGASGATFGLMLAFAMIWPDMPIHVWGIFPVKAKWLVGGLGVIQLLLAASGSSGNTAVLAHLGGLVTGFLYLKSPWGPSAWGEVSAKARKKKRANLLAAWAARRSSPDPRPINPTATSATPRAGERELLDDVDRILDKISEKGLSSLTEAERKRLDEVSRRYRTN